MSQTSVAAEDPPLVVQPPPNLSRRLRKASTSTPAYMTIILIVMVAFFTAMRPDTFASLFNIRNIFLDASSLLILATG